MRAFLVFLVRGYRYAVSPMLGHNCRFHPSCSEYAEAAISEHGALRGGWLAARRVACCNPWHAGGFDPVPEATHRKR